MRSKLGYFIAALACMGACKEEVEIPSFKATINGDAWESITFEGTTDGTAFYLTGTSGDGTQLEIYLAHGFKGSSIISGGLAGQLPESWIRLSNDNKVGLYLSAFAPVIKSGELTFTSMDTVSMTFSGTFSASIVNMYGSVTSASISGGSFTRITLVQGPIDFEKRDVPLSIAFAKINGVQTILAYNGYRSGAGSVEPIYFNLNPPVQFLSVSMPQFEEPGTYTMGTYEPWFGTWGIQNNSQTCEEGTLTITHANWEKQHVTGTFSMSKAGAFVVTDGVFSHRW
jgi:hypothetical protein